GPARPYHISCLVGPKLKSSIAFSRLAKRASDTTAPSLTSPSACLVFSGVTRLRVPRSSSLPQRPQLESDCSIATTCSKVTRCAGSWVDGCDVIDVVAGAGAARCSWAAALPIWFANKDSPTSATVPAISFLVFVVRVFIASSANANCFITLVEIERLGPRNYAQDGSRLQTHHRARRKDRPDGLRYRSTYTLRASPDHAAFLRFASSRASTSATPASMIGWRRPFWAAISCTSLSARSMYGAPF